MKLVINNVAAQREAGSSAENMHLPKKSNTSVLKTLLLLALMLVGSVGVSWATDYTTIANFKHLESDFQASGTDQLLTGNGCDMVKFSWSGIENTTETIDDNKYYKFTDNDSYVKVKFYHEYNPNAPFIAGDIVRVHLMVTNGDVEPGFILKSDKGGGKTVLGAKGSANQDITVEYTLTENDINTDGSISIYRTGGGYATRYYSFEVAMKRHNHDVIMSQTTGGTATFMVTSGDASCALNTPVTRASVSDNATIKLANTPNADILFWGWQVKDGETWKASWDIQGFNAENYTVTKPTEIRPNFTEGIKINAIHKDGTMGTINVSGAGKSGTSIHITPYPGTITFTATPNAGYGFVGWYEDVDCNTLATSATTLTYTNSDAILTTAGTINRWAKFEATTKPFIVTADWTPTIPANAVGWGLATVHVKADGVDVDASEYTLNYEVVDGHLSLGPDINGLNRNATVTGGFNGTETAHVKVTATPKDASKYTAASVTFDVNIKPVAKPNITVAPKAIRIGESVTLGVTREIGFDNPHYEWTLSDNAKTCLYGYTEPISETQADGAANPTHTFVAKAPTSSPISVNLKFYSDNGYYNNTTGRMYEEANVSGSNGITVKPVTVPTVTEDVDGVHFTFESDYTGVNGSVDAWLEYYYYDAEGEKQTIVQDQGKDELHGAFTTKALPQGIRIFVKSVIYYKDADNGDHWASSSEIQYVTDKPAVLPAVELMKQPRWANGVAKRYIPIGKIDADNTSLWPEGVTQGMGAIENNTMGYILNGGSSYTIDKADKGLLISQYGKTSWGWNEGKTAYIPKSAAFYMDVAGTLDVILYVENSFNDGKNDDKGGYNENRRWIKVWYLNDQCKDGKPIQMASWGVVGKRGEGNSDGGNELRLHVRLPQLGTNGKTTLFFTYEGDGYGNDVSDAEHNLWVRGFLIKRPDLPKSIGRTDDLYNSDADDLTHMCVPTKNTPYVWSFEPRVQNSAGNNIHTDGKDAVGFRPASDTDEKKNNENDGRIYICGEKDDHLLIYSDNYDIDPENPITPLSKEERPELDGRYSRDRNSHIELVRPTIMAGNNGNDNQFNPIRSNGLKLNVTGSGWFKVIAAAPYCDVKMRVLTSTNGGMSKIRVLKEFIVKKSSEMGWTDPDVESEFTAYLKAQVTDDNTYDEDATVGDPEKKYMSLYVVFEAANAADLNADGTVKDIGGEYPQLNIHQMSWLNELPADYVFQREENPKLLTEWREIKRGGKTMLWWKTANDDDAKYPVLKENGNNTYNRLDQFTTSIAESKGVKSPDGCASTTVPSYNAYWDIAAPASTMSHTENAYAGGNKVIYNDSPQYINAGADNTEFDLPVSGSFLRICAMENTYVIAHVLPNTSGAKVYVLDETGSPIPSSAGSADDKKRLGYITAMSNVTGENITTDGTIRIDFCANAGKEYFICANGASISLARLEVVESQYSQTKATTLALEDNANNSTAIAAAYDTKEFYRDATLKRKPASDKWFSIVLPFSLNEKKFKQIFGDDARCLHFTDVDTKTNTVKLTHHYYNMIVAGRPVFVRTSKSFADEVIAMNDITLQAREVRNIPTDNDFVFYASYDNAELVNYDLYMNNANAVKYLKTSTGWISYPGMRAFIKNNSHFDFSGPITTQQDAKTVFLNFFDEDESATTGIEELVAEEFGENVVVVTKSTKVYDLSGRIVGSGAELGTLPAGVYVVNGKKYIVK